MLSADASLFPASEKRPNVSGLEPSHQRERSVVKTKIMKWYSTSKPHSPNPLEFNSFIPFRRYPVFQESKKILACKSPTQSSVRHLVVIQKKLHKTCDDGDLYTLHLRKRTQLFPYLHLSNKWRKNVQLCPCVRHTPLPAMRCIPSKPTNQRKSRYLPPYRWQPQKHYYEVT